MTDSARMKMPVVDSASRYRCEQKMLNKCQLTLRKTDFSDSLSPPLSDGRPLSAAGILLPWASLTCCWSRLRLPKLFSHSAHWTTLVLSRWLRPKKLHSSTSWRTARPSAAKRWPHTEQTGNRSMSRTGSLTCLPVEILVVGGLFSAPRFLRLADRCWRGFFRRVDEQTCCAATFSLWRICSPHEVPVH